MFESMLWGRRSTKNAINFHDNNTTKTVYDTWTTPDHFTLIYYCIDPNNCGSQAHRFYLTYHLLDLFSFIVPFFIVSITISRSLHVILSVNLHSFHCYRSFNYIKWGIHARSSCIIAYPESVLLHLVKAAASSSVDSPSPSFMVKLR
jgi:hypothetical protein